MLLLSLLPDTFYFAVFCCKLFLKYLLPRVHLSPLDLLRRSPESVHTLVISGNPLQPRLMGSQTSSAQTPAAPTSASPLSLPSGPTSLPVLPLQPLLSLGSNSFPGGCPPPSLPSQRPAGTGPLCPPFCVPARQIQGDVTFPLWKQPR